jgi:hypothetical protein
MKKEYEEVKIEAKAKFTQWNNVKSKWIKVILIVLFLTIIALKVLTTIFTFDWIIGLFN